MNATDLSAANHEGRRATRTVRPPRVLASLILLLGVLELIGGTSLIVAGGSFYYVIAGTLLVASAVWLWRGERRGAGTYALFLGGTLVWALWEAGLNAWALTPRLALPALLGVFVLVSWLRGALK